MLPVTSGVVTTSTMNAAVPSSFEKLEGAANYRDWKFAMEAHLYNCDLWDYVDGSKDDERQNERECFVRERDLAMS